MGRIKVDAVPIWLTLLPSREVENAENAVNSLKETQATEEDVSFFLIFHFFSCLVATSAISGAYD